MATRCLQEAQQMQKNSKEIHNPWPVALKHGAATPERVHQTIII
jgi:hypothetical protein